MEIIINCILLLIVVAVAMILSRRLCKMKKAIEKTKEEINLTEHYVSLANIAAEHANSEQMEQIQALANQAIENSKHLDGFNEYVSPVLKRIIENTKRLTESGLEAGEREVLGRNIEKGTAHLTNVIENVLLMARIHSDNVNFDMKNHDVESLVVPVYESFKAQLADFHREVENKGDIDLSIGKGIPMQICCDNVLLTKVLEELVKNACQFTEKGNIQMGWFYRMMQNEVEIFIEDNGIGIKDEDYNRVFNPFFKADPEYSGVGIGLTIAKELTEKMGGKLRVISRGDFGTRMSVLFQRAAES